MITYGSTTLTSYNTITKIEVYYYQSTSPTTQTGGSWSTTKPTWVDGRYVWQKIRTTYEGKLENGQYYSESDPVNITGQQGATGTAAYSYKLNSSDSIIGKTKDGEYTIKKITFSATYKQGTGAVSAYGGRFKIESTTNGSAWKTEYTSSGNEASKEFTIPDDIILIKCSLYQSDGTTVLLDIVTVPVVKDGVDAIGLRDSIPYYLASDKDTGITKLTQGWTRYRLQLTAEKKYLWVYYVSRYSEGTTEPELIEIKDDLVHFVNNGDESPVESCVVDIEPMQAGSGDPSPDNVRSITGWTGAKVTRTGINVWDEEWELGLLNSDGSVSSGNRVTSKNYIPVVPNKTYCFSFPDRIYAAGRGAYYDADKNLVQYLGDFPNNFSHDGVRQFALFTVPENASYLKFCANGQYGATYNNDIFINYPSTDTDYHSGTDNETYSITFPSEAGTVYGGTLDVTKGELVVDRAIDIMDGTRIYDNGITSYGGMQIRYSPLNQKKYGTQAETNKGLISNLFRSTTSVNVECTVNGRAVNGNIYFNMPQAVTSVTLAQQWFVDNPTQISYELATPITYTLTPQEITMLCKENNIFADTGQTAISYYDNQTSTDPYVDYSLTSAFDASTTALDKVEEVTQDLVDLQAQIDGKIETWCQSTDPSTAWTTTELKNQHNGDLWYYTGESTSSYKNNTTYKYTASTNKWTAYSASTDLFDKIDGKTAIYYGKPSAVTQNLEVGDYLVDSTDGCSYRWDGSKWVKLTDYNAAIDAIKVGGKNLLRGTKTQDTSLGNYRERATATEETLFGCTVFTSSDRWADIGFDFKKQILDRNLVKAGDSVTYSIWAKTDDTEPRNIYGVWVGSYYSGTTIAVLSSEWTQYSKTFIVTEEMLEATSAVKTHFECNTDCTEGKYIYWAAPKLERGTKATDWTPAPEDVDSSIATAQSTADTAIDRATAIYGTCSTDSTVDAKVVICPDFVLFDGARIQVTFTYTNTASAPTLNVNNTGAKAIYINKTVTSSSNLLLWTAGSKMEFVYDGTGWIAQNIPYALYGTCSTGASTAAKVVTCNEAVICKGTTISINMTNTNTAANATMNVGSTVAKDIYANGTKLTVNSRFNWRANTVQKFVFDGQVWRMDDDSVKALATAYITEIDEDGIMVHPEDDSNSGWAISDAIQLFKNGISYIKLWIENNIPKIRIGKEDQGHIILDNDSVDVRNGDDILASFGETSIIGDQNQWHQTIASDKTSFANGQTEYAYISPDKFYAVNAEVSDAFYIGNYSIRNAKDGKLIIGLRRK